MHIAVNQLTGEWNTNARLLPKQVNGLFNWNMKVKIKDESLALWQWNQATM